jgi:hypothetical protein
MNSIKYITPAALLLLATIALPTQATVAECLKYEPMTIELKGIIRAVTFPGPPNYRSIKEGDKPERYWILYLQKPICVDRDSNNDTNQSEEDIKSLQLIIQDYDKYRNLLGQHVIVKGELMHAITGHHHTNVLIKVREIKKAQQFNEGDGE